MYFLFNLLSVWMPWITECILLLRVFAIFKPNNFVRMAALLAFPVTIKTIRAVLNIVFLAGWKPISNANRLANQFNVGWVLQVSWILELVDNA
ncbi:hypothetical protein H0H81_004079 [Sphagnurus paluster]|uniref:Uncharacterized protein n=1 Tax=Sphagnurus paluster TaxID=117069 RepID=A0A9P7KK35_9AGAR|nr:hypothetical protein H0H81_004079 [Sphagnurus paluster]